MPITERLNLSATTETTPKRLIEPAGIFAVAAGALRNAASSRNTIGTTRE
jgi:primosomal replication protein N